MCFNKKVIAGLVVVGLGILAFAPHLIGAALPLLLVAACPLSMLFMMRGMSAMSGGKESSCSAKGAPEATSTDHELAELRAEVERLRAEQAQRTLGAPADSRLN